MLQDCIAFLISGRSLSKKINKNNVHESAVKAGGLKKVNSYNKQEAISSKRGDWGFD